MRLKRQDWCLGELVLRLRQSIPQSEVPVNPVTGTEVIPSALSLRGNSQ
jgi:hypothetical protein